jgi:urease accessory protein
MTTADESLAAILQLASPALPIGAFSYSSGLEMAIELGWVNDAASAQRWISSQLDETVLHWEVPLWGQLYSQWAMGDATDSSVIHRLNTQAVAARETAELRSEHTQMGHALRRWCNDVLPEMSTAHKTILNSLDPLSVMSAHALAAHTMRISAHAGATAYAFGYVENQVMAASKAIPLGQTASQQCLRAITAGIAPQVVVALALPEARWSSAAPLAAIASMKHETQYTRLFRS